MGSMKLMWWPCSHIMDFPPSLAALPKKIGSIRSRMTRMIGPAALEFDERCPSLTILSTRLRRSASNVAKAEGVLGAVAQAFLARITASSRAIEAPCPAAGEVA